MSAATENSYSFGNLEVVEDGILLIPEKKVCGQDPRKCVYMSLGLCCVSTIIAIAIIIVYVESLKNNNNNSTTFTTPTQPFLGNITVFYAASLVNLMTNNINPGFTNNAHYRVNTQAAASGVLSAELALGVTADVFISAATTYDTALSTTPIPGWGGNKKVLSWWTTWGSSRLGIGYNIHSPYASTFQAIANGSLPWYLGLNPSIMKIGRTDPDLDPKGARTVIMTKLAQIYYNTSYNIEFNILGSARNTLQLYTEQQLETLLSGANLDVGFFYECEHAWNNNLAFIPLPSYLDFSNSSLIHYYNKANYTSQSGKITVGSPIIFTASIPNTALHTAGAILYIENLISSSSASFFNQTGLYRIRPFFSGNQSAIPTQLLKY
jgi:molybdate/tungstate transport system substrate-binding protein